MMKPIVLAISIATFFGTVGPAWAEEPKGIDKPTIRFEGGDGSSMDKAIIIAGAEKESAGIAAEMYWIHTRHPDWVMVRQSLIGANNRKYDKITYATNDGNVVIYFDITTLFGRY